MKRSEMLKIMMDTFHEGMSYKQKMLSGMELEQAEKLLSGMEKAGMAPPNRCEVKKTTFVDSDGEDQEFEYEQYSHTWENE